MNKLIVIIAAFLIIAIAAVFIYKTDVLNQNAKIKSPVSLSVKQLPTKAVEQKLKEYIDPAGFKFSYPQDLEIISQKAVAESIYALLDVNSNSHKGKITIKLEDTTIKSIEPKNKDFKNIKLADLEAKQYTDKDILITQALDKSVLITITADFQKNKEYWTGINDKIIASFLFSNPQTDNTNQNSSAPSSQEDDVISEGEEVVE